MQVKNPTYCISAFYFDTTRYSDPTKIGFEVFLSSEEDEEAIEKTTKKLKELSKNVHYRNKKLKQKVQV